jgi:preprotein translocase subunit SecA
VPHNYQHAAAEQLGGQAPNAVANANHMPTAVVREGEKIGRNDPCPCGSGKKYKQCHGKLS